ncbi:hypothetical protein [Sphingomonas hankyongi]|uniref:Uncharacterized protein n=1 Tax=Sphingomonas hankyongi TaxID=2908209 RepID=A0ABT0S1K2_9SPHN|nr:hypothetical protein [Sphingomonas hankyongi]MCL6729749.1 hypothetical protein [Sphingomonas hankyongi]
MTEQTRAAPFETRLPQLRGRWVSAYQLLWVTLAIVAAGVMTASIYRGDAEPAVLMLRLIKTAVLIAVCAILLRNRKSDPVAALLSLAFLSWAVTSNFDFSSPALVPMLADRLRFLLFAIALLLFPDGSWRPRWTRSIAVASMLVFVLGIAEGTGIAPSRLFLPAAVACILIAIFSLIVRFRDARSEAVRQQLKWVALGLVAGVALILIARAGASLSRVIPQPYSIPVLWEGVFQLGIIVVALGFLTSLLRYRLFDAETAISRSAALAVLTLAIVATFAGTEASIEWIGQQYFGMGIGNISAAMAAAVAAVILNPLHNRISDWAEHRFQRDLVTLKRDLPELLVELSGRASTRELGTMALPRIRRAMHASRVALIVHGKVAAVDGIDLRSVRSWARSAVTQEPRVPGDVFPTRIELNEPNGEISACLALGPRPDGTVQAKDELAAIAAIAPNLRRAIAAAGHVDRHAAHQAADRRLIAKQIDLLSARLAELERTRSRPLIGGA